MGAEEIERMVKEAEGFKADDDKQRERAEAKNGLEGYAFQVKQSLNDEQLASKVSNDDKVKVKGKVDETLAWLDEPDGGKGRVRAPAQGARGRGQPGDGQFAWRATAPNIDVLARGWPGFQHQRRRYCRGGRPVYEGHSCSEALLGSECYYSLRQ